MKTYIDIWYSVNEAFVAILSIVYLIKNRNVSSVLILIGLVIYNIDNYYMSHSKWQPNLFLNAADISLYSLAHLCVVIGIYISVQAKNRIGKKEKTGDST